MRPTCCSNKPLALDPRDAGLASEIVFGCLRYQAQLDHLISCFVPRPPDPEIRMILRMGIYQLRYLDRIPPHAAVGESVELAKRARKQVASGLVNAVLRKVDRKPLAWPDQPTELSMPAWLTEKWERQFGAETTEKIATTFLKPVETHRASTGRIQDISAQSVVPHLDLHPGMTFLDLCAAPGNKTAQALEYGVRAIACDIHLHRLKEMQDLDCPQRGPGRDPAATLQYASSIESSWTRRVPGPEPWAAIPRSSGVFNPPIYCICIGNRSPC